MGQLVVFAAVLETTTTYLLGLTTDPAGWSPQEPFVEPVDRENTDE